MQYWVAVTDNQWFNFLSGIQPDEINFWHPSGKPPFTRLPEGTPFLFKLKSPNNHIAGLGFFCRFSVFPLSLVWEAFGEKNGRASKNELLQVLQSLRANDGDNDPPIGCSILASPIFFPKEMWIKVPSDWKSNIVSGKSYDTASSTGTYLWDAVSERMDELRIIAQTRRLEVAEGLSNRFGTESIIKPRLGQGGFRLLVTDAYNRKCAMTGEKTLPVLEAAHIQPYSKDGMHEISNGLLLRSDFHKLFDNGLITVTPEYKIEVSKRIREEWFNGDAYYRLHGKSLAVMPKTAEDRPSTEALEWHNQNVYTAA